MEILKAEMKKAELIGDKKEIFTDKGVFEAEKVILANGTSPRRWGFQEKTELWGKGMGKNNVKKDGEKVSWKNIDVVGGADGAVKEALYLAKLAAEVTIIHFEHSLG